MPKRATRRPVRTKSPQRRSPPRPRTPQVAEEANGTYTAAVPETPSARVATIAPAPAPAKPVRRGPAAARRTVSLVVDYTYLRRDIRYLLIIAPCMVILVVIAYFIFG